MKTYWRSGGIAPRILDFGTLLKQVEIVVCHMKEIYRLKTVKHKLD